MDGADSRGIFYREDAKERKGRLRPPANSTININRKNNNKIRVADGRIPQPPFAFLRVFAVNAVPVLKRRDPRDILPEY